MIYTHKKTGGKYRWLAAGTLKEAGAPDIEVAIYCPDDNENSIFCREAEEFYELFEAAQ